MDELKRKNEIDITENMAGGCVKHIISTLKAFSEIGYDRLYWDGYNSSISLYKSCRCGKDEDE